MTDLALLGDVCQITMGQAPPGDSYNDRGEGIPLVAGAGDFTGTTPAVKKFTTAPGKVSRQGDIILGIRASIGERVWSDRAYCLGRGVAGLRPSEKLDRNYLWHWLGHSADRLKSKGRGATFLQVNRADINEMEIPLPSLDEQQRIAAILDQADEVRHCRTRLLTDLDLFAVTIFNERFGSGIYPSVRLGNMAEIKGGKRLPKGTPYADRPTKHPYIRVVDLRGDGVIDEHDLCFITEETHQQIARYVVGEDDVVISIAGTIGLTAAVPKSLVGANLTENAARIVPRAGAKYRAEWLAAALRTPQMQAQISGHVGQVTIGKLALFRIEKLELEVPPLDAQDEYLSIVRAASDLAKRVTDCSALDHQLIASLQARAFSGEL